MKDVTRFLSPSIGIGTTGWQKFVGSSRLSFCHLIQRTKYGMVSGIWKEKTYHILETIPYSGHRLPYPRGPAVAQLFSRWSALAVLTAIQPAGVLFSVNSHAVFYAWMCYSCLDMEAHALSRYKQTGQVGCRCWMRKMSSLLGWFNSEILSAYSTQCEQNKHRSYHQQIVLSKTSFSRFTVKSMSFIFIHCFTSDASALLQCRN